MTKKKQPAAEPRTVKVTYLQASGPPGGTAVELEATRVVQRVMQERFKLLIVETLGSAEKHGIIRYQDAGIALAAAFNIVLDIVHDAPDEQIRGDMLQDLVLALGKNFGQVHMVEQNETTH